MKNKLSIRFFKDKEVPAVWDEGNSEWWYSAVDIAAILSDSKDARNYWYVLKSLLKKTNSGVLTNCKGLKMTAQVGKKHLTDCFDSDGGKSGASGCNYRITRRRSDRHN